MEKKMSLESITALLQAAERIRSARNNNMREDGSLSVKPDALTTIRDTMQIICDYLPDKHRAPFNNAIKHSHHYCGTYRELKKHLRDFNGQNPDFDSIIKTFKVVMPMLETRQRAPLGKIVNVLEALHN